MKKIIILAFVCSFLVNNCFGFDFKSVHQRDVLESFLDRSVEYLYDHPNKKEFFLKLIVEKFDDLKKKIKSNNSTDCKTTMCIAKMRDYNKNFDEMYRYIINSLQIEKLSGFKDILSASKLNSISKYVKIPFYENLDPYIYNMQGYDYDACINYGVTKNFSTKCFYPFIDEKDDINNVFDITLYRYTSKLKAQIKMEGTNVYSQEKKTEIDISGAQKSVLLKLDCYHKIRTIKLFKENFIIDIRYNLNKISEKEIIGVAQKILN